MPIRRTTTAYKNTAYRKKATLLESSSEAQRISSIVFRCLCAIALVYAFLAGLRTINDYDLGWQMAMGRFIALDHTLPSTDIFSYTALGKPWIYPILSELIFYGVFKIGGYALLSWMGAAASAATVMILLRRSSIAIAALAILAVPPIAEHTCPRADMFTLLMFAGFLKILWQHHRQSDGVRLWLLPVLMIFWVNLHLGFIAGLALLAASFTLETAEIFFPGARRATTIKRVKTAWPWLLLTLAATLVNPWGWTIYLAIYRQYKALAFHDRWITEWSSLPLHWESIASIFDIRNTNGTLYILLAVAAVSLMIAIFHRKLVEATLLVGASYLVIQHIRFVGLFACIIVMVSGEIFATSRISSRLFFDQKKQVILTWSFAVFLLCLATIRSVDLITNRHFLRTSSTASFGAGLSWWFPERAMRFIEDKNLPPEVFNSYNLGGYLIWRLAPRYRDYIDGRAIPFGPELFRRQKQLMQATPDSPIWEKEIDRYGIHFMVVSMARYDGLQLFPLLRQYCASQSWTPVYMDEISAVFVRTNDMTDELAHHLRIDCSTTPLPAVVSNERNIDAFNQWANAAAVLLVLGRTPESIAAADKALSIFPANANALYIRAKAYAAAGQEPRAESDFLSAIKLEPNDVTWAALAQMYRRRGDHAKAIDAFQHAVRLSSDPHLIYLALAYTLLENKQAHEALGAFDTAVRTAPPTETSLSEDDSFPVEIACGRAATWAALGDLNRAVVFQQEATHLAPERTQLWLELAKLYQLQGRMADAQRAAAHANSETHSPDH